MKIYEGIVPNSDIELKVGIIDLIIGAGLGAANLVAVLFGKPDSAIESISGFSQALKSISIAPNPSAEARALLLLAVSWSLSKVNDVNTKKKLNAKKLAKELAAIEFDEDDILDQNFFDLPSNSSVYIKLKNCIASEYASKDVDFTLISVRLDSVFNRSIFAITANFPERFRNFNEAMNSRGYKIGNLERQWKLYRENLKAQYYTEPVFGQEGTKVPISELYIGLRAIWKPNKDLDDFDEGESIDDLLPDPSSANKILYLDEELDIWAESNRECDNVRVIGGGPGSGKSTTLKALASRLAAKDECFPLYIPLQRIDISSDLRSSIERYLTRRGGFRDNPISKEFLPRYQNLILILDGLDELALPNATADAIASDFAVKLELLKTDLGVSDGANIKIVMSGRLPAFQAASRHLNLEDYQKYEVLGYAPYSDHCIESREDYKDIDQIDQREMWWNNYVYAIGSSRPFPSIIASSKLASITNEPLLCYLLAISGMDDRALLNAAENPNIIYRSLLGEIWKRGWSEGERKGLERQDFGLLMETIALAAWYGGDTRVATEENFKNRAIDVLDAHGAWETFTNRSGEDVANLAMNFYLKGSDERGRGFEFTHKSFGDYLLAQALLRVAFDVADFQPKAIVAAAKQWCLAANGGKINDEIFDFLKNEILLRIMDNEESIEEFIKIRVNLMNIFEELVSGDTYPDNITRNIIEAFYIQLSIAQVLWSLCGSIAFAVSERRKGVYFDYGYKDTRARSLSGLYSVLRWGYNKHELLPTRHAFVALLLENQFIPGEVFYEIDFSRSLFKNVDMFGCILTISNFIDCVIKNSSFRYIFGVNTNWSNSNLVNVKMEESTLSGANFSGSNMHEVDFRHCTLNRVSFIGASLSSVNFKNANLNFSSFVDVDIKNCVFTGAHMRGARIDRGQLKFLNLTKKQLSQIKVV